MDGHQIAQNLAKTSIDRIKNEATTRHQIIDVLLHSVLCWPTTSVTCEDHVQKGYIDYVLRDNLNRAVLLIEAKSEGVHFALPDKPHFSNTDIARIKLRILMTDKAIDSAIRQVVAYCPSVGCDIACITNGHVFILFRWHIKGLNYTEADALVIPSLECFHLRYTKLYNLLSYTAVIVNKQLHSELFGGKDRSKDIYYAKRLIEQYDDAMQKNQYACYLDPIAKRYFDDIEPNDKVLMDACYVFAQGVHSIETGVQTKITDRFTPYFASDGVKEITETRSGGPLTKRIAQAVTSKRGDIIILFGGKGAGKSTFLRRLFYCNPPPDIQMFAMPIIVDYLQAPQEKEQFEKYTWTSIRQYLDINGLLNGSIEDLVALFGDRYSIALRQELCGLTPSSESFIVMRNRLIAEWKADDQYVINRLKCYWGQRNRGVVLTFDNTDQLSPSLQDHCFLIAQNVARTLDVTVIISMREERYCRARTVGVLDAYHNFGFHLAAPDLQNVLVKRLKFVISELTKPVRLVNLPDDTPVDQILQFFKTCLRQFTFEDRAAVSGSRANALKKFLQECSHDNTRLALGLFSQFMSSGYTHAAEMIAYPDWIVVAHQVIKPMMIPTRYNYDETKSLIPNFYQIRFPSNGSHFTTIRVLSCIKNGIHVAGDGNGFQRVIDICDNFDNYFGMREDCELCIDVMLSHGILEADNRLDALRVEKAGCLGEYIYADSVRLTAFGSHMLDTLCKAYTYLELVSFDTGVESEALCHEFVTLARKERARSSEADRKGRLLSRVSRVSRFVDYLHKQEQHEQVEYAVEDSQLIVPNLRRALLDDLRRVRQSAERSFGAMPEIDAIVHKWFDDLLGPISC